MSANSSMMSSLSEEVAVARRRDVEVLAAGFLGLLFEAVEDVDGFRKLGDVDDTVSSR